MLKGIRTDAGSGSWIGDPGQEPYDPSVRASLAMRETKIYRLACRRMLRTAAPTLTVRSSRLRLPSCAARYDRARNRCAFAIASTRRSAEPNRLDLLA